MIRLNLNSLTFGNTYHIILTVTVLINTTETCNIKLYKGFSVVIGARAVYSSTEQCRTYVNNFVSFTLLSFQHARRITQILITAPCNKKLAHLAFFTGWIKFSPSRTKCQNWKDKSYRSRNLNLNKECSAWGQWFGGSFKTTRHFNGGFEFISSVNRFGENKKCTGDYFLMKIQNGLWIISRYCTQYS